MLKMALISDFPYYHVRNQEQIFQMAWVCITENDVSSLSYTRNGFFKLLSQRAGNRNQQGQCAARSLSLVCPQLMNQRLGASIDSRNMPWCGHLVGNRKISRRNAIYIERTSLVLK
jgi:hypothetical protein